MWCCVPEYRTTSHVSSSMYMSSSLDALVLEYDSALPTNPIREGHPRIPEAEKAKLWWSHEDLQGFALEELNRQRPDRPSDRA